MISVRYGVWSKEIYLESLQTNCGTKGYLLQMAMVKKADTNSRESDLSHSMVHYLLTIHELKEQKGYARVTDIAKHLDLTKGSVSTAINNLKKKGLVEEEEDSKFLLLTSVAHDEVHQILSSRALLFHFLRDFVGVEEDIARSDSCQMEHLMSPETSQKFFNFMKDLACSCEKTNASNLPPRFHFKTALDLCKFDSSDDFVESQKSEGHSD